MHVKGSCSSGSWADRQTDLLGADGCERDGTYCQSIIYEVHHCTAFGQRPRGINPYTLLGM